MGVGHGRAQGRFGRRGAEAAGAGVRTWAAAARMAPGVPAGPRPFKQACPDPALFVRN